MVACNALTELSSTLDVRGKVDLTKMEVVVIAISEEHEGPNNVDNGFHTDRSLAHLEHTFASSYGGISTRKPLTHGRWILPKVTGLISS